MPERNTMFNAILSSHRLIHWGLVPVVVCLLASCEPREARYLIIHADDAGMSSAINQATIESLERGLVSSVSIMVPCPAFEEFAEYARSHPEMDFGIHLTLNSEWNDYRWSPVAPHEQVPSLIDNEGFFWRAAHQVEEHVDVGEAEIELRAQIDKAIASGIRLSHLDSHMFALLTRPDLARLYIKLGLEYELPVLFPRSPSEKQRQQRSALDEIHAAAIKQLDERKLPIVDRLETDNYSVPPNEKRIYFLNFFHNLQPGVTELLIHCGLNNDDSQAIRDSAGREAEYRSFTSPEFKDELDRLGIKVVSWRDLRELKK